MECGSSNLAPAGCTQYFYGNDAGTVKTYNYAGGLHLANQQQVQCIRREKGLEYVFWLFSQIFSHQKKRLKTSWKKTEKCLKLKKVPQYVGAN